MLGLLKHKVVQGTLWYSLVGVLTSGMNVLLLPFFTRWMTPYEFGVLNSALAISALAVPCVSIGLGAAVVRYYHEYRGERDRFTRFFSAAFWLQLLAVIIMSSTALSILFLDEATSVGGVSIAHLIPVLLVVALNPPRDLGNQLLTSKEDHSRASMNQLVAFAAATIGSVVFIGVFDLGALGRLYGLLCGAIVATAMLVKLPELRAYLICSFDAKEALTALKFGVPYVPYALAMAAMLSADKLVLQKFLEFDEVGIYSAAKSVALGMSAIFLALTRAWYPRYFALRDEGDERRVMNGQWSIMCLLALMVTGFVMLAPVVFPLLVDISYIDGLPLMPVLAMGIYAYGLFVTQASYINYLKKTFLLPFIAGLGALCSIAGAFYWIPKIGIEGAAWSTLLGYLVMVMSLVAVSARLEGRLKERVLLPFISLVLAVSGVWCANQIPVDWLWLGRLLVACVASGVMLAIWRLGSYWLLSKSPEDESN